MSIGCTNYEGNRIMKLALRMVFAKILFALENLGFWM